MCPITNAMKQIAAEEKLRKDSFTETLLGRIPEMEMLYRSRGWPEEYFHATLRDFEIWARHHFRRTGEYGISPREMQWFEMLFSGQIIRIGRLQFATGSVFGGKIHVFRHSATGELKVLAWDGIVFDRNGYRAERGWKSVFRMNDAEAAGNPIVNGTARNTTDSIRLSEWNHRLDFEEPMIAIHVPEDGRMEREACIQSLHEAVSFFHRFFPEKKWKGFYCHSWFLDPVFQTLLPEESNIVRFQRMGTLYPIFGQSDVAERIFAYDNLPEREKPLSSLQKAVRDQLAGGTVFHPGGMFLLKEQILKPL